MRINHNISAVIANNRLKGNETKLSESVERLSSGFKINHAYDDAAGMAISNKMQAQIRGLDQSSRNSSDGVSVIETAEAALNETENMLQRMRELAVQAGNDTNTLKDREAMQAEVDSLSKEITRISTDTEFNKKTLLDGSLARRTYTSDYDVRIKEISDKVQANEYSISVDQDARQAVFISGNTGDTAETLSYKDNLGASHSYTVDLIDPTSKTIVAESGKEGENGWNPGTEGIIAINGVQVKVEAGDTAQSVYEKIRDASAQADVACIVVSLPATVSTNTNLETAGYTPSTTPYKFGDTTQALVFVSEDYGADISMKISCDNEYLAQMLGIGTLTTHVPIVVPGVTDITVHGLDAKGSIDGSSNFNATATMNIDGNDILITDRYGFEMKVETTAGVTGTKFTDVNLNRYITSGAVNPAVIAGSSTASDVDLGVTNIGTMTLQIGANEGQIVNVDIPDMSAKGLDVDDINIRSGFGVDKALVTVDKAISKVSEVRSKMGAYQNRLEHTVNSLDATSENMTAALSRIKDVDMAEEMTVYTQYSVLSQAATSVLGQANDIPQQVLQLLK